jgi:hypothetical protein
VGSFEGKHAKCSCNWDRPFRFGDDDERHCEAIITRDIDERDHREISMTVLGSRRTRERRWDRRKATWAT